MRDDIAQKIYKELTAGTNDIYGFEIALRWPGPGSESRIEVRTSLAWTADALGLLVRLSSDHDVSLVLEDGVALLS